jgi:hypothetical protein
VLDLKTIQEKKPRSASVLLAYHEEILTMLKKLLLSLALLASLTSCSSSRDKALDMALRSEHSEDFIRSKLSNFAATPATKAQALRKLIGKNHLTYFISTVDDKQVQPFRFTWHDPVGAERAQKKAMRFRKNWTYVTLDEIQNLKYEDLSDSVERGTFSVSNECFDANFIYFLDKNSGRITKMLIPHKTDKSDEAALTVFDVEE